MFACELPGIALLVVCSLSVSVSGFLPKTRHVQYQNKMCSNLEEVADHSTCKYGTYINPCGKWDCYKGVRDECDDPLSTFRYGECAEGLTCNCGKCQGCVNKECYEDLLCPVLKGLNNFYFRLYNYTQY